MPFSSSWEALQKLVGSDLRLSWPAMRPRQAASEVLLGVEVYCPMPAVEKNVGTGEQTHWGTDEGQ